MRLLYDGLGFGSSSHPFTGFKETMGVRVPEQMEETKDCALVIWGGQDIGTSLYGQTSHYGSPYEPSNRDLLEIALAEKALKEDIPIIGVCRGAQLLCALGGGKLIQDVDHHTGSHPIITHDGEEMITTSLHHQMMFPWEMKHRLYAWASPSRSKYYHGEGEPVEFPDIARDRDGEIIEPEIVWFHDLKTLAIQGHPEFFSDHKVPFIKYCNKLIKELF